MFIYFILLYKTNHLFFIFSFKKTKINFEGEQHRRLADGAVADKDELDSVVKLAPRTAPIAHESQNKNDKEQKMASNGVSRWVGASTD